MADHPICAPTIRARMKVFVSEFNRTRTISSAASAYQVNNKKAASLLSLRNCRCKY